MQSIGWAAGIDRLALIKDKFQRSAEGVEKKGIAKRDPNMVGITYIIVSC